MEQERQELLTVQQFASTVGITPAAVYKRLDTTLKQYEVVKNGKKYIQAAALSLYDDKPVVNPPADSNNVDEALKAENERLKAEITRLTMERDNLREQLARELEVSRERLARAEGAEALNKELIVRFPPQLPAAGEGGGLFGWFRRKKGGQGT